MMSRQGWPVLWLLADSGFQYIYSLKTAEQYAYTYLFSFPYTHTHTLTHTHTHTHTHTQSHTLTLTNENFYDPWPWPKAFLLSLGQDVWFCILEREGIIVYMAEPSIRFVCWLIWLLTLMIRIRRYCEILTSQIRLGQCILLIIIGDVSGLS